jgi:hypothetical protein
MDITSFRENGILNLPFFPTTVPRMSPGRLHAVCPTPYQPHA